MRVEPDGWLVEKQDFGLVQQRSGNLQPALHPAGEGFDYIVAPVGEFHIFQPLVNSLLSLGVGDVVHASVKLHIFPYSEVAVNTGLLEDDADRALDLCRLARDVAACYFYAPAGGSGEGGEHANCGGFAGSVGSEESKHFAGFYGKGEVADDGPVAVGFVDVLQGDGGCHGRLVSDR